MYSSHEWRKNLELIRQKLLNSNTDGWRNDYRDIAGTELPWRNAVNIIGQANYNSHQWRNSIQQWAENLGISPVFRSHEWRRNLQLIAEYYGLVPIGDLFCLNTLPANPLGTYVWLDTATWNDNNFWID